VGGDKYFEICARHLVEREGFLQVRMWLSAMKHVFLAGQEAVKRFDAIFQVGE
jgi:hypothetical protein